MANFYLWTKNTNVAGRANAQLKREIQSILDFKIVKSSPNRISSAQGGMYASTLFNHDISKKQIKKTKFNYLKDFQEVNNLARFPVTNLIANLDGKPSKPYLNSDAVINSYVDSSYLHDSKNQFKINSDKWLLKRCSQIQSMNSVDVEITVPGNHLIEVGDIVKFDIPQLKPMDEEGMQLNQYLSGKFLITRCRQSVRKEGSENVLTLSKDSFDSGTGVPENASLQTEITQSAIDYISEQFF